MDRSESRAHGARLGPRALPAPRVRRALKGRKAARDLEGLPARSVRLARRAPLGPTARPAPPARREILGRREIPGRLGSLGRRDRQGPSGLRDRQGLPDQQERPAPRGPPDRSS